MQHWATALLLDRLILNHSQSLTVRGWTLTAQWGKEWRGNGEEYEPYAEVTLAGPFRKGRAPWLDPQEERTTDGNAHADPPAE